MEEKYLFISILGEMNPFAFLLVICLNYTWTKVLFNAMYVTDLRENRECIVCLVC